MKRFSPFPLLCLLLAAISCEEETAVIPSPEPLQVSDTSFVDVPGGVFTNSRGESIEVGSFQMLESEVNNRLYRYLAEASGIPHPPDPGFPGMEGYFYDSLTHPVVNISPARAKKAASAIGCRLPTRNEWEYAASLGLSGDISSQYPWGELHPPEVPGVPANYLALDDWSSRDLDGFSYTAPCGSYPLSRGGFQDIAGNVAEMAVCVQDSAVHLMGGSWVQNQEAMQIGYVRELQDGDICWYGGFRLVR